MMNMTGKTLKKNNLTTEELDLEVSNIISDFTGTNAELKSVLANKIPDASFCELAHSIIRLASVAKG
jgi:hypothetical protein